MDERRDIEPADSGQSVSAFEGSARRLGADGKEICDQEIDSIHGKRCQREKGHLGICRVWAPGTRAREISTQQVVEHQAALASVIDSEGWNVEQIAQRNKTDDRTAAWAMEAIKGGELAIVLSKVYARTGKMSALLEGDGGLIALLQQMAENMAGLEREQIALRREIAKLRRPPKRKKPKRKQG